jgi:hypothetical protein
MKRVMVVGALIGAMVMTALAQGRPDFSGTWEMDAERTRAENRARAAAAGAAAGAAAAGAANGAARSGGGGGGTMGTATMSGGGGGSLSAGGGAPAATVVKITQTANSVTVDRVSGQVWEKVVHKVDGTESVNTNGNSTMKLKSRWEGAKLVSEGTSETKLSDGSGSITSTVKEVRWMEKPGVMAIEITRTVNTSGSSVQLGNSGRPNTTVQYFVKK